MKKDELMSIFELHGKWLREEEGGERANLFGADLSRANLSGANLSGAKLAYSVGGNNRMHCLQVDPYKIIVLDKEIAWEGCTKKTVQEWLDYSGDELVESDKKYLETVTKPFLRMVLSL